MPDLETAIKKQIPEHIRDNVIVLNGFQHTLHIVCVQEVHVLIYNQHYRSLYSAAIWPFTVGQFPFVRQATQQEIAHVQRMLKERTRTTKAS